MQYTQQAAAVTAEVNKAVQGKQQTVNTIWMAMLAGGHVLIEDIPGVGKTTLALAFARALDLKESRVQFTPDVLPSDLVGFSVYQKETGKFVYHSGCGEFHLISGTAFIPVLFYRDVLDLFFCDPCIPGCDALRFPFRDAAIYHCGRTCGCVL